MSCVIRGGARICGAPIPFNPPDRHSATVLAHCASGTLGVPHGVEGTSTRLHGHERAGDGVSPAARQQEKISPESLEETRVAHQTVAHGVEPAAVDPPGSPTKWVGEKLAPAKEGGTAGNGVRRASSLRQDRDDEGPQ